MGYSFSAYGDFDWNLLKYLEALVEERSVSGAAKRVGLSQPGMSRVLSRLRTVFDDELLVRDRNGMTVTNRAEQLLPMLRAVRSGVENCIQLDEFHPSKLKRRFKIAGADLSEYSLYPGLIRRLQQIAPDVSITWVPAARGAQALIESTDVDIVIEPRGSASASSLMMLKLFEERFTTIVRKDHPVIRRSLTLDQFCSAEHALIAPRGTPGGIVDRGLSALGRERKIVAFLTTFLCAPYLVATTDLIATVPHRIAEAHAKILPIKLFEPPLPVDSFTMAAFFHQRHEGDPAHRFLREILKETALDSR